MKVYEVGEQGKPVLMLLPEPAVTGAAILER